MDFYDLMQNHAAVFLLMLTRVTGIFILSPFFGSLNVPQSIRVGAAVAFSFAIFPGVDGLGAVSAPGTRPVDQLEPELNEPVVPPVQIATSVTKSQLTFPETPTLPVPAMIVAPPEASESEALTPDTLWPSSVATRFQAVPGEDDLSEISCDPPDAPLKVRSATV